MNKINCNIINDILPLYADEVVSDDTKALVEEHLAKCAECTEKYEQMKREIELNMSLKAAEAEKQAMLAAKKKLRKKRMITAIISGIAGAVLIIVTVFILRNIRIPIKYDEKDFRVAVEKEYDEDWLFVYYDGLVSGHDLIGVLEGDGIEEKMYIRMYTTPWDELFRSKEKSEKQRICVCSISDSEGVWQTEVTQLRLIAGDIKMMYSPSMDWNKMADNSVLLWERGDGLQYGAEAGKGVKRTQ